MRATLLNPNILPRGMYPVQFKYSSLITQRRRRRQEEIEENESSTDQCEACQRMVQDDAHT
jgi:ribosomal protein L37AE/L43A